MNKVVAQVELNIVGLNGGQLLRSVGLQESMFARGECPPYEQQQIRRCPLPHPNGRHLSGREAHSSSVPDILRMSRSVSDTCPTTCPTTCPIPIRTLPTRVQSAGSLEQVREAGLRLQKSSLVLKMLLAPDLSGHQEDSGTGGTAHGFPEIVEKTATLGGEISPANSHGTPASGEASLDRSSSKSSPVVRMVRMKSTTMGDDVLARIHGLLQQK